MARWFSVWKAAQTTFAGFRWMVPVRVDMRSTEQGTGAGNARAISDMEVLKVGHTDFLLSLSNKVGLRSYSVEYTSLFVGNGGLTLENELASDNGTAVRAAKECV
jgi:hypothetical protein